jgi:hypothetical protein
MIHVNKCDDVSVLFIVKCDAEIIEEELDIKFGLGWALARIHRDLRKVKSLDCGVGM